MQLPYFPIPSYVIDYKLCQTIWDNFPLGVLVVNKEGIIVYCNQAQASIDDMDRNFIVGKAEIECYGPYLGPGICRTPIESGEPILGYVCDYRTRKGKIIKGAYWVFPIFEDGQAVASVCFTQKLNYKNPIFANENNYKVQSNTLNIDDNLEEEQEIIGTNKKFRKALSIAQTTANSPSPVLISGETGSGKEIFANAIKEASSRANKPYQAINCSAIPATLLEGILFGVTKGSFTGAIERPGLFEEANGGIIYLDEIDSMTLDMQPKLLRVLQEMRVRRVGSSSESKLDVKVISSISGNPKDILASGRLRPDLYYRLAVISIAIPPLKERMDDLEALTFYFIKKYNKLLNKKIKALHPKVKALLQSYHWPGNIRELEHIIAAAINLTAWEVTLQLHHIPEHHRLSLTEEKPITNKVAQATTSQLQNHYKTENTETSSLIALEIKAICSALETCQGHLTKAAKLLGISRQLLSYKLKKHNINRLKYKAIF